jgi:ribosomal protein S18 acetylase RimI-like enzyme
LLKPLTKEHASKVALLHIQGISSGFISSLGEKFVTALYEAIAISPYGFGFVHEDHGDIVGFVAFTTGIGGLYKSILKKNLIRFSLLLFVKMFSLRNLKKIAETLLYPNRVKTSDLPNAELLSIAVAESARGRGIAKSLIKKGMKECCERGIERVKVMVADFNKPANELYQKVGFEHKSQIESHGTICNIYIARINR